MTWPIYPLQQIWSRTWTSTQNHLFAPDAARDSLRNHNYKRTRVKITRYVSCNHNYKRIRVKITRYVSCNHSYKCTRVKITRYVSCNHNYKCTRVKITRYVSCNHNYKRTRVKITGYVSCNHNYKCTRVKITRYVSCNHNYMRTHVKITGMCRVTTTTTSATVTPSVTFIGSENTNTQNLGWLTKYHYWLGVKRISDISPLSDILHRSFLK